MNILHCVSSLKVGGAEKLVKNLAISQQGNSNVSILSFGLSSDAFQPFLEKENIQVKNIRGNFFKRTIQSLIIIKLFDVIHIHSPAVIRAFILVFPCMYLMKFFGINKKIIYTIHGEVAPNLTGMKFAHKIALLFVSKTFAVSEQARLKAEKLFAWPKEKIKVIKNGVLIPKKNINKAINKKFTLGVVARLIPLKRIEDIIICIAKYKLSKKVSLKIFGDGPEKDKLQQLIGQYNLAESIHLMGSELEESNIFTKIDCLVICSETEGLPMVLLEGMGYEIPCISTRVGAIPQVINESHSGFLFDVGNTEQLATQIELLVISPNLLKEKGKAGKQYVMNNYSIETLASTYLKYYEQ